MAIAIHKQPIKQQNKLVEPVKYNWTLFKKKTGIGHGIGHYFHLKTTTSAFGHFFHELDTFKKTKTKDSYRFYYYLLIINNTTKGVILSFNLTPKKCPKRPIPVTY